MTYTRHDPVLNDVINMIHSLPVLALEATDRQTDATTKKSTRNLSRGNSATIIHPLSIVNGM